MAEKERKHRVRKLPAGFDEGVADNELLSARGLQAKQQEASMGGEDDEGVLHLRKLAVEEKPGPGTEGTVHW